MVAHLVLYELKPDLAAQSRDRLRVALQRALTSIPSVRSARLGRRTAIGASYESQMSDGFSYFALFEFDDADALRAYLEHPAHAELGALFWECGARTLVLDFELAGNDIEQTLQGWISAPP